MPELDQITRDNFERYLGETFTIEEGDQTFDLKLVEVRPLGSRAPSAIRDPFGVTFAGDPRLRGPQKIYQVTHPVLGALEIFLVPIAPDARGSLFEAIFN